MLPAATRMRSSEEFRATVRQGVRAGRPTLVVHGRCGTGSTRVGFIVSKAVGNAVVRNRVKRRLRHLAAEELPTLPGAGCQFVIRALPPAATSPELADDFRSAWLSCLGKLGAR
ncbi:ribonuclease P protein component [Naumannella halotolerans]|uniref:ribonuclease P protein component n=1 Tax=Naumannella halotolerans TaxID=993414 RepID=UPI00370D1CD4